MFERLKPVASANQQQTLMAPDIHQSAFVLHGAQPADPFILWLRHFNNWCLIRIFHSRSAALSRAFINERCVPSLQRTLVLACILEQVSLFFACFCPEFPVFLMTPVRHFLLAE